MKPKHGVSRECEQTPESYTLHGYLQWWVQREPVPPSWKTAMDDMRPAGCAIYHLPRDENKRNIETTSFIYIYIKAAECHISHLPVDRNHIVWSIYTLIVFVCMERWFRAPRTTTLYPFSHNHGSKKWVPPIVVTFQIQFHFHYFLRKSTQHFVPHPNFLE